MLFVVLLLGLIVPYQALLTPLFFLFVQLNLHNSLLGLAIIHTAIQLPFSIYVMRNAFEAVPRELEEAAIMDGCNSFEVLLHICLPAVVPAMITVSLFAFITSWNELLAALVIMNKDSSFTLPLILAAARQQTSIGGTDWGMLQAGITISIIPCMAFYLLLQKYYMARFPHRSGQIGMQDDAKSLRWNQSLNRLTVAGTPTIRDVARLANVSIGTASKALNSGGRLSKETRENVLRVAHEIGYRPNHLAQSLHRAKSRTIGIISNDSFGRFTFPIVEALEERLAEERIAVFMCNATDDPARERQHLDQLLGKRIDGLVVTARRADKRPPIGPLAHGLPVVYVFSQADDPDALSLLPDDEGGAVLAISHLAALGRKRIAHITGPEHFEAVRLRNSGYRAALAQRDCLKYRASICRASGRRLGGARRWLHCLRSRSGRTRSSAAMTRSRAAQSTCCAKWASACRATSQSSVSTIGTS